MRQILFQRKNFIINKRNETKRNETQNETAAILENLDIQAIGDIEKFTLYPYACMRVYFYILRFKFQRVRLLAAKVYQSKNF